MKVCAHDAAVSCVQAVAMEGRVGALEGKVDKFEGEIDTLGTRVAVNEVTPSHVFVLCLSLFLAHTSVTTGLFSSKARMYPYSPAHSSALTHLLTPPSFPLVPVLLLRRWPPLSQRGRLTSRSRSALWNTFSRRTRGKPPAARAPMIG